MRMAQEEPSKPASNHSEPAGSPPELDETNPVQQEGEEQVSGNGQEGGNGDGNGQPRIEVVSEGMNYQYVP